VRHTGSIERLPQFAGLITVHRRVGCPVQDERRGTVLADVVDRRGQLPLVEVLSADADVIGVDLELLRI
jgi:hypothetical protein